MVLEEAMMNFRPHIMHVISQCCAARRHGVEFHSFLLQCGDMQSDATEVPHGESFNGTSLQADAGDQVLAVSFKANSMVDEWSKDEVK